MSKRHDKQRISSVRTGATPTKERRRQHGGVTFDVIDRDYHNKILVRRYRAVWECPLDAYVDKGAISVSEHWAGLKFREAYFQAVLCKAAICDRIRKYTPDIGYSPGERVLKEAYRALSHEYKGAVVDICGHDQPARDMAKLDRLKKGLGQLAELWRAPERPAFERR